MKGAIKEVLRLYEKDKGTLKDGEKAIGVLKGGIFILTRENGELKAEIELGKTYVCKEEFIIE